MKTLSLRTSIFTTLTLLTSSYAVKVEIEADPSHGCQNTIDHATLAEISTKLQNRPIKVTLPPSYDAKKPNPLILVYNDRDVTLENMVEYTGLSDDEVNKEAVVVYVTPQKGSGWLSDANFPLPSDQSLPPNTDITWTITLLKHLEDSYCLDKRRIHATGIGTGGGMLSLLACNRPLSRRISSFAAISAAFYDDQSSTSPWAEEACEFGRRPIPLMEIHGNRDTRWGYWPPGIEGEVQGLGPVGWLDVWKGRQNCGEKEGDPRPAEVSNATYISKLENGGLSEGVEFAGGAVRVAYRCDKSGSSAKEKTEVGKEDPDMRDVSTLTLLHYSLRDIGYGWPRLDLQREEKIKVNGHEAFPPGDVHFDATKLILEWFETHPLPNKDEIWRQAKELLVERGGKIKTYPKVDEGGEKVGKAMTKDEGEVVEKEEEGEKVRKEAERGSERWRDEL